MDEDILVCGEYTICAVSIIKCGRTQQKANYCWMCHRFVSRVSHLKSAYDVKASLLIMLRVSALLLSEYPSSSVLNFLIKSAIFCVNSLVCGENSSCRQSFDLFASYKHSFPQAKSSYSFVIYKVLKNHLPGAIRIYRRLLYLVQFSYLIYVSIFSTALKIRTVYHTSFKIRKHHK
jgi:hypothetical protein